MQVFFFFLLYNFFKLTFSSSFSLSNNNNNNNNCFYSVNNQIGSLTTENLDDNLPNLGITCNGNNFKNGIHFIHLWTPKVQTNLQQAFRFSEKILAAANVSYNKVSNKNEQNFQDVFQDVYLNLQKTFNNEKF